MNPRSLKRFERVVPYSQPALIYILPLLLIPVAILGPNFPVGVYGIVVLSVGLRLLWRPGEPPILPFIFLYQWLQSAGGALYGNATGTPLSEIFRSSGRAEFASVLMVTGTLALALAMRSAAGSVPINLHHRTTALVNARPISFWLRVYVLAWLMSAACKTLAPLLGGLRVPLITMAEIRWVGFILLTVAAFTRRDQSSLRVWGAVFAFEFFLSIGGFFSSFKDVFLYALFGLVASNIRLKPRNVVSAVFMGSLMIGLGLVWTAIKTDYRSFVNAGTGQQVVLVSYGDQVQELARLITALDEKALPLATNRLAERIVYYHFFGAAAANVPQNIPYSNGAIWGEALTRPFTPRLLFSDKRAINDSDLTNQYTGLNVATSERGTSISMGYMAESYIDFGPILMFAPIIGVGLGLGWFYRWLLHRPGAMAVIGAALAPFALMPAHAAETSALKMVSSLILTLLVCIVVLKVITPVVFGNLIKLSNGNRRS